MRWLQRLTNATKAAPSAWSVIMTTRRMSNSQSAQTGPRTGTPTNVNHGWTIAGAKLILMRWYTASKLSPRPALSDTMTLTQLAERFSCTTATWASIGNTKLPSETPTEVSARWATTLTDSAPDLGTRQTLSSTGVTPTCSAFARRQSEFEIDKLGACF